MKRIVFNDGDGNSYHYENRHGDYYSGVSGTSNNTVFRLLGLISSKERHEYCEKVYGHSTSGNWPTTEYPDKLANLVHKLKDDWLKKFGTYSYVLIDGVEYKYVDEKPKSYPAEFTRGTKLFLPVTFTKEMLRVTIKSNFLDFSSSSTDHYTICDKIDSHLKKNHSTNLRALCTKVYGYTSDEGIFPGYKNRDMKAATAIYRELRTLFKSDRVDPSVKIYEDMPSYKVSHPIEKVLPLDSFGYPTRRFKKGDTVKVQPAPADRYFKGWKNSWVRGMGHAVGKTFEVVTDAEHNGVLLRDPVTLVVGFVFPHHMLQITEAPKTKPTTQTISTDLDLDIPIVL